MKSAARQNLKFIVFTLLLACGPALTAQAQNREKYVISARAGGVNFVAGNVTVERQDSEGRRALTVADNLQAGDIVTTGTGGRAEVLLNPGTYLRLDERSELELVDTSLEHLLVSLVKGSAVVEVTGADEIPLAIGFSTPQVEATIIRGGIYRFNALPNETTEVLVRKGRVLLDRSTPAEIKGGRKVIIGRGGSEIGKLDKKDLDSLDLWSKDRAQLLARANRQLQPDPLRAAFTSSGWYDLASTSLTAHYYQLGMWVYDRRTGAYCFVPIGGRGWSSPYGHHYWTGIGFDGSGNNWPGRYQTQGAGNGLPSGGGAGNSPGGNGNTSPSGPTQTVVPSSPPPTPPANDSPVERGPRREYTGQSPN